MSQPLTPEMTQLLQAAGRGDAASLERLLPLVYEELRKLARNCLAKESSGHTLQPTALVHEVFLKLISRSRTEWKNTSQFYALCSQAMRRILVDHARRKKRVKRGGVQQRVPFDDQLVLSVERPDDLLAVHEALEKLARLDVRQARIVEMRFFGGMGMSEVAAALGVSKRTVEAEWTHIRAWLRRELSGEGPT